jgi:hypothetical protein
MRSRAAQLAEASSAETNWAALRLLINYFRSKCVDAALTWMPCRRFCNICSPKAAANSPVALQRTL